MPLRKREHLDVSTLDKNNINRPRDITVSNPTASAEITPHANKESNKQLSLITTDWIIRLHSFATAPEIHVFYSV